MHHMKSTLKIGISLNNLQSNDLSRRHPTENTPFIFFHNEIEREDTSRTIKKTNSVFPTRGRRHNKGRPPPNIKLRG